MTFVSAVLAFLLPLLPPSFDRGAHSTSDPTSPWVVVNKRLPLTPADFEPDLVVVDQHLVARVAARDLTALLAAAERAGLPLHVASAYRSAAYQRGVYEGIVGRDGRELADRWSARPGHSEHQTGLAVDVDSLAHPECRIDACFGELAEGRWVRRHARHFGFLVRYTPADQAVTGYHPEPWHLRYVGRPLAREMERTGVTTLEVFFGLPAGDYAD
jgi:zinc D-Ala-D-Ala carboxypeptidase